MRRIVTLFFILFISISLYASWNIGYDCRSIDALWKDSMRFDIEGGYRYKDIRVSATCSFGICDINQLWFFDGGLSVSVYPFSDLGLNVGTTVFRIGKLMGIGAPDDDIVFLSEAFLAWTISFGYVYIEPRLTFSDTLSSENTCLTILREEISQYSRFRLSLLVGVGI